jgi:hypothetical protein
MPAGQETCPLDEELAALRYAVYLLYWYKSTNTDAAAALRDGSPNLRSGGFTSTKHKY